MSTTSNFQTWLIKARKKSEWTYAQLAIKSGVSTATIHALEHSGGSPSLDTVEKLCKALGTSVEAALRVRTAKPYPTPAPAANDTAKPQPVVVFSQATDN